MAWHDKQLGRCVISYREKKATVHKTVCWDYAADQVACWRAPTAAASGVRSPTGVAAAQFFVEEDVASHALPVRAVRRACWRGARRRDERAVRAGRVPVD